MTVDYVVWELPTSNSDDDWVTGFVSAQYGECEENVSIGVWVILNVEKHELAQEG